MVSKSVLFEGEIMLLKQLEYLVTVVEARTMVEASEILCVSHQNVSKVIKQLENELGFKVIERGRNKIVLTEKGEKLYFYSKQMLDLKKQIENINPLNHVLKSKNEPINFLVMLGFMDTFKTTINRFNAKYDEITCFVEYNEPNYITQKLKNKDSKYQLFITVFEKNDFMQNYEILNNDYEIIVFTEEQMCLVVKELYPLKNTSKINFDELKNIPIIIHRASVEQQNFFLQCICDRGFKSTKIQQTSIAQECGKAVAQGVAATIGTVYSFFNSSSVSKERNDIIMVPIIPQINIIHVAFIKKDASDEVKKLAYYLKTLFCKT